MKYYIESLWRNDEPTNDYSTEAISIANCPDNYKRNAICHSDYDYCASSSYRDDLGNMVCMKLFFFLKPRLRCNSVFTCVGLSG